MEDTEKHEKVVITYNGPDKEFPYRRHEKVRILLDEAIRQFGITTNPHLMGLFTTENVELDDAKTLEEAGVKPDELLVLRVSSARGGTTAR